VYAVISSRSGTFKISKQFFIGLLLSLMLPCSPVLATESPALESRVLKIGSELNYPPYAIVDANGEADGFSVDIIKAAAREMALKLEFEVGPWNVIKEKLKTGKLDALPLVAYSNERAVYFDFSSPYIISHAVIFVRDDSKGINSPDDIRDKEVLVMRGDSTHEFITNSKVTEKIFLTNTLDEAFKMLAAGQHDAVVAPELVGLLVLNQLKLTHIKHLPQHLDTYGKGYGFAVRKGNGELLEHLNRGLVLIKASGEYDRIYNKWFGDVEPWHVMNQRIIVGGATSLAAVIFLALIVLLWNRQLRKRVQEAMGSLHESEQRFSATFSQAAIGLALVGLDGKCLRVNQTICDMVGYSNEELMQRSFQDITHPDDLDIDLKFVQQMLAKEIATYAMEKRYFRKSGSIVWVNLTVSLVLKENGEPDYFISAIEDITERKQDESEIQMLLQAVEQSSEAVVITAKNGSIQYVNPAFTQITGYSEAEAIGKNPRILKSGNQKADFYLNMWETLLGGQAWQGKVVNRKKNGDFFPSMLTISPIKNQAGEITNYIGLQQDLSGFESMEAQFHQAQKMEAIGTLVGGIAHDFNNILAGMTGNLYLAKKHSLENPAVLKKLAAVEDLSFHAAELIKQLLTFARKGAVSTKPFPLTPFIKETIKLIRPSLSEGIALHYDICNESLVVNGDATQLHQVLLNLINNARDALDGRADPCITVRLAGFHPDKQFIKHHVDFSDGEYAHLSVEDNGCGVEEGQLEHLFEPFYTTKEQGKGTGLGLAMSFGAIKTHGGHIEVASTEGIGSTFHIYLPLCAEEIKQPAQEEFRPTIAQGGGELLLLVDDDRHVREAGRQVLESIGYRVMEASDGLDAIDVFTANQKEIALVIMDVVMPNLGGVDAWARMREIHPQAEVIFLTGYDKGALGEDKVPSDNHVVLSKPYDIAKLSQAIRNKIERVTFGL